MSQNGGPAISTHCFGKLPGFSDFIRVNAGTREVLQFDRWLQEGIYLARERLREEWQSSYWRAPTYCFAFHPASSQQVSVGLLVPSHDSSDRLFPFVVAVQADRTGLESIGLWRLPLFFGSFFEQAADILDRARGGLALPAIDGETRRLRFALSDDAAVCAQTKYADFLDSTSVGRLCEEHWDNDDPEPLYVVFNDLREILSPLRGRNPDRLAMGIRFRIPRSSPSVAHHVTFWLDIAHAVLRAGTGVRPFIFWTSPEANNESVADYHLFLFLREPTTRTFAYFLRPDLHCDFICELGAGGPGAVPAARDSLPARIGNLLERRDVKLRELVRAVETMEAKLEARRP